MDTKPNMTVTFQIDYPEYYAGVNSSSLKKTITHTFSGELNLMDMLEEFESFLKAGGYIFSGHIGIDNE